METPPRYLPDYGQKVRRRPVSIPGSFGQCLRTVRGETQMPSCRWKTNTETESSATCVASRLPNQNQGGSRRAKP
jgi:hypothetical protein